VPRSRGSTVPAGRAFSLQATRLVSSSRRPAVGSAATTPRSPGRPQPDLEAVAAVLHGQAGLAPALLDIPITMNGTRSDCCSLYAAAGLCPVRLPHGSRGRGAPLIDYGAVTMGYRYTARRPYSARRRTSRRCSPQGAIAGEPGTRAPHVAVTSAAGRFPPSTCTDGASCCLLAGANGAAWISAVKRVMQRLGVPLDVYIASVWSWEVLKWRRRPRIASGRTARC